MRKHLIILCVLLFAAGTAMADHTYDSLYAEAIRTPVTDSVDKFYDIGIYFVNGGDQGDTAAYRQFSETMRKTKEDYCKKGDEARCLILQLDEIYASNVKDEELKQIEPLMPRLLPLGLRMTYKRLLSKLQLIYSSRNDIIAMQYAQKLIELYPEDSALVANSYATIALCYRKQGDYHKAASNFKMSLRYDDRLLIRMSLIISEAKLGECDSQAQVLATLPQLLRTIVDTGAYLRARAFHYECSGPVDSAVHCFERAISFWKGHFAPADFNLFNFTFMQNELYHLYEQQKNEAGKKSIISDFEGYAKVINNGRYRVLVLTIVLPDMIEYHKAQGDYKQALDLETELLALRDSNTAYGNTQKYEAMEHEAVMDKAEKQLKEESKLKDELAARRSTQQKIAGGAGLSVLLMMGLFGLIQYRNRKIVQKEKDRSEGLLLNILPSEVADELKAKGSADAKLFDDVTVLFTDFKGFTTISERLTPQQLVDELHACFSAFDAIMQKHGIEKIKTVGDAYLAVSGLPIGREDHAAIMVRAAIEIRDFMLARKKELGDMTFEIRIGVHSGSVVAGIVGVRKFAYDIWGDTVNTAARMEQNSEAGRINISQSTYELVKEDFTCKYRGEIEAKNKGKLKMYFVEPFGQ